MNKLIYLFTLFFITVNAQQINLKILDYSTNLSIDNADVYFAQSTKNFISNLDGKVIIDLANINSADDLIVSKKDYQDAKIKVANLKTDLTIKLEKISEVELQEAFVRNLKAEDILQKAYDNYDKNFTTEEHYYVVNFKQDEIIDTIKRDFIDLDLQLRFKSNRLNIKSINNLNDRILNEPKFGYKILLNPILRMISLKSVLKDYLNNYKKYNPSTVRLAKYGDEWMYEFYLDNKSFHRFLIAKNSFAVVEYKVNATNIKFEVKEQNVNYINTYYRYRPYQGKYILKEFMREWSTNYKELDRSNHIIDVKINLEVKDFSSQPFPKFKKYVNEKMDIRRSFD